MHAALFPGSADPVAVQNGITGRAVFQGVLGGFADRFEATGPSNFLAVARKAWMPNLAAVRRPLRFPFCFV
jgi:hypothetical protein